MPLTQNFSATESLGIPAQITLVDTSTGSDLGLTSRRVSFQMADQQWLVNPTTVSPTIVYQNWPIVDLSLTLTLLPNSVTLNVTVDWLTNGVVTYTKTVLTCFDLFDYVFALNELSNQTSSPQILADTNYFSSFLKLIVNIFNAENAVIKGDDQYSSQGALNLNLELITNSNDHF